MRFADIHGNPEVLRTLPAMVDSGRIPHAILFSEPDGGPAFSLSLALLQYLFCPQRSGGDSCGECPSCNRIGKLIHPDVHFVFPVNAPATSSQLLPQLRTLVESKPFFTEAELSAAVGTEGKSSIIAVAEAREVLSTLALSALEGGWRAVVIYLPEKMNQEAANRLLKSLEEPAERTIFILITHAEDKLLPTIASRCQHIRLGAEVRSPEFEDPALFEELMEAIIGRDLFAALEAGEKLAALPSRESAKAFCRYASDGMRNIFLTQQGLPLGMSATGKAEEWAAKCRKQFPRSATGALDRAHRLLERNVNAKIVFTELVTRLYSLA